MRKRGWPFLIPALVLTGQAMAETTPPTLAVREHVICEPVPECETIGRLRLHGALVLPTTKINGVTLAGLSGLAWDADEKVLHALSDNGAIFQLRPVIRNSRLVDAQLLAGAPILDPTTGKPVRWMRSDSEGLEVLHSQNGRRGDSELVISFEGEPRLARYRPDGKFIADVPLPEMLAHKSRYHYNRMLESVCLHPREGLVTAPEEPLVAEDKQFYLYRVRDGARWRLPALSGGISALECTPDGSVLLLERELHLAIARWRITLRRLTWPANAPDHAELNSETLAILDNLHGMQLDNFEGMAHHTGQRFFMVSDNNNNLIQQTLLVYFEIISK